MEIMQSEGGINQLMNTIKLPKNMDLLINRLPKKKYTSVRGLRAMSADVNKSNINYGSEKADPEKYSYHLDLTPETRILVCTASNVIPVQNVILSIIETHAVPERN